MFISPLVAFFISATGEQPTATCNVTAAFTSTQQLLQNKDYDGAARSLDTLDGCSNLLPPEVFERGWLYGRTRHFSRALDVFKTVPPDVPDQTTHGYAVALSNFELGRFDQAVSTLERLRAQAGLNPDCANLLAVSYSKLESYEKAASVLADEIERVPHDLAAYLNLITLKVDTGELPRAAEIAQRATVVFPDEARVFTVSGSAALLLGHLDEARAAFQSAIRLSPANADPRFFLALTDYKRGAFTEAIHILDSAEKNGIADADLHYLKAECLLKQNPAALDQTLQELNRALQLNSNSVSARTMRGKLYLEQHQTASAIRDLTRAHELDATSRNAIYNLARAYRLAGKPEEAKPLFAQLHSQPVDAVTEISQQRLSTALKGGAP